APGAGGGRSRPAPAALGELDRGGPPLLAAADGGPSPHRGRRAPGAARGGGGAGRRREAGARSPHRGDGGEPVLEAAERLVPGPRNAGHPREGMNGWSLSALLPGLCSLALAAGLAAALRRWYDPLPPRFLAVFAVLVSVLFASSLFGGWILL